MRPSPAGVNTIVHFDQWIKSPLGLGQYCRIHNLLIHDYGRMRDEREKLGVPTILVPSLDQQLVITQDVSV